MDECKPLIGGLDKYILKSGTLSSTRMCPPFGNMMFQVAPIVKVAVEAGAYTRPLLSST